MAFVPTAGLLAALLASTTPLGGCTAPQHAEAAVPAQQVKADTGWRVIPSLPGFTVHDSIGRPADPGPFLYWGRAIAGLAVGPHRHSQDMKIWVKVGRKFILMGNPPEAARVQVFEAGQRFVIPADMWHVEWWESETIEEISGQGPMRTDRPPSVVPERR